MHMKTVETVAKRVHQQVPAEYRNPDLPRTQALKAKAMRLWFYLSDTCLGRENAQPAVFIAGRLGLYQNLRSKDCQTRMIALSRVLVGLGYPVCSITGDKAKPRGMFVGVNREEIEKAAAYYDTMAAGFVSRATALRACEPFTKRRP